VPLRRCGAGTMGGAVIFEKRVWGVGNFQLNVGNFQLNVGNFLIKNLHNTIQVRIFVLQLTTKTTKHVYNIIKPDRVTDNLPV